MTLWMLITDRMMRMGKCFGGHSQLKSLKNALADARCKVSFFTSFKSVERPSHAHKYHKGDTTTVCYSRAGGKTIIICANRLAQSKQSLSFTNKLRECKTIRHLPVTCDVAPLWMCIAYSEWPEHRAICLHVTQISVGGLWTWCG